MKIDYKDEYVYFGDIVTGECFEYMQKPIYMKINQVRVGDLVLNALNLSRGTLCTIDLFAKVRSVNLKIVKDDEAVRGE